MSGLHGVRTSPASFLFCTGQNNFQKLIVLLFAHGNSRRITDSDTVFFTTNKQNFFAAVRERPNVKLLVAVRGQQENRKFGE